MSATKCFSDILFAINKAEYIAYHLHLSFTDRRGKDDAYSSLDPHVGHRTQRKSLDNCIAKIPVCGSVMTNTHSGELAFRKDSAAAADCSMELDLRKFTNNSEDDVGIYDETLSDVSDKVKTEKRHSTKGTNNELLVKYTDTQDHSNNSVGEAMGVPQGAVLPPPLFPPVFNGNVLNPLFSRSTFLNDPSSLFKHPFDMLTRGIPYRFPMYYSQMAPQSLYRIGGQSIAYQIPTHSDVNKNENDLKGFP